MSSDNCIAILHTKDKFKYVNIDNDDGFDCTYQQNMFDNKVDAYRVIHTQGIDNYDWYKEKEIHNLGYYMHQSFLNAKLFYDYDKAVEYSKLLDSKHYTEYGIIEIDATNYNFPGC